GEGHEGAAVEDVAGGAHVLADGHLGAHPLWRDLEEGHAEQAGEGVGADKRFVVGHGRVLRAGVRCEVLGVGCEVLLRSWYESLTMSGKRRPAVGLSVRCEVSGVRCEWVSYHPSPHTSHANCVPMFVKGSLCDTLRVTLLRSSLIAATGETPPAQATSPNK